MCLDAYDPEGLGDKNHFLSPGICSDQVLRHFPRTRIIVAGMDPLRDGALQFSLRMVRNKVDV